MGAGTHHAFLADSLHLTFCGRHMRAKLRVSDQGCCLREGRARRLSMHSLEKTQFKTYKGDDRRRTYVVKQGSSPISNAHATKTHILRRAESFRQAVFVCNRLHDLTYPKRRTLVQKKGHGTLSVSSHFGNMLIIETVKHTPSVTVPLEDCDRSAEVRLVDG